MPSARKHRMRKPVNAPHRWDVRATVNRMPPAAVYGRASEKMPCPPKVGDREPGGDNEKTCPGQDPEGMAKPEVVKDFDPIRSVDKNDLHGVSPPSVDRQLPANDV